MKRHILLSATLILNTLTASAGKTPVKTAALPTLRLATSPRSAGQPAQNLELNLAGIDELYLVVQDFGQDAPFGKAAWANARFMTRDGLSLSLQELKPQLIETSSSRKPESLDRLDLGETTYTNALTLYGPSVLKLSLNNLFDYFTADILQTESNSAALTFELHTEKPELLSSPRIPDHPSTLLTASPTLYGTDKAQLLSADIQGVNTLYLLCTDGGDGSNNDHAAWGHPELITAAGERVKATTLPVTALCGHRNKVLLNKNAKGQKLSINSNYFEYGFGAQGITLYKIDLDREYARFEVHVGLESSAKKQGSIGFEIHRSEPTVYRAPDAAHRREKPIIPYPETFNTQTIAERIASIRRSIEATESEFTDRYDGEKYLRTLQEIRRKPTAMDQLKALRTLQREALLGNPALDFDHLVLLRRQLWGGGRTKVGSEIGMVYGNYNSRAASWRKGGGQSILKLKDFKTAPTPETIYAPKAQRTIADLELDFDANRIMFSSINADEAYRLYEVNVDGSGYRQITSDDDGKDVDHFDACYLPGGDIIFTSTATFNGMPCINGTPRMSSLFRYFAKTGEVRQLSFDQDSSWGPTVANDGRILYLRWEYTDMNHSNNRVLMTMNPDGTAQRSWMFSNSYFPASFFHTRPIPGSATKAVGIATGHHGVSRSGRMLLVDRAKGTQEAEGVVQELPGYGKTVKPEARDRLVDGVWPHITHPYPIAESGTNRGAGKYFIVAMKQTPYSLWGLYLIDIYDNRTLIYEEDDVALLDPIPLKPQSRPQEIPGRINPSQKMSSVFIQDIYHGPGLADIPRGTVKSLQVVSYEFSPSGTRSTGNSVGSGGIPGTLGMDGPWDIKRILGSAPVYEDGSAHFTIPANTPVFLLPLDEHGQALQIMRTWMVGLPGERVSCIGCHESGTETPLPKRTIAGTKAPVELTPWQGNFRNFGYPTEIQPIIDANCMSCHDGQPANGRYATPRADYQNRIIPDLGPELITDYKIGVLGSLGAAKGGGRFSRGYVELFRLTRGPGIESDMAVLTPKEFSADSTELVQMLKKGHHGVDLSDQEWRKIYNWIDLNTPYHGNRRDIVAGLPVEDQVIGAMERSNEIAQKYNHVSNPYEKADATPIERKTTIAHKPKADAAAKARKNGTKTFQAKAAPTRKLPITLDLGDGLSIRLVYIPAGSFVMGSANGALDELPMHEQTVKKGFWMAEGEITNAQMRQFDSAFSSRYEDRHFMQFGQRSFDVNGDELPAVRLSWNQAQQFCRWLSEKTGKKVTLPTEVQWEWACRAEQETPFWFGPAESDFADFANLADVNIAKYAECTHGREFKYLETIPLDPTPYDAYVPRVDSVNDGAFLATAPKSYKPNPWGLHDMHGNVAEWTRSSYRPYPLNPDTEKIAEDDKVVRGGSWRDRPHRATSSYRLGYPAFQKVYNVGFRIIIEDE
jgi:formylglycine-generating enzyme required for sulfatase activity